MLTLGLRAGLNANDIPQPTPSVEIRRFITGVVGMGFVPADRPSTDVGRRILGIALSITAPSDRTRVAAELRELGRAVVRAIV